MEVKGYNGTLEVYRDKVRIKRKGFMAFLSVGLSGDKEILISHITSIQVKKPGFTNGYIQFSFRGGKESKGGLLAAGEDENTILFTSKQETGFLEAKEAIQRRLGQIAAGDSSSSGLDELEKLASLRDKGILTEEEFQAKKKQILGL